MKLTVKQLIILSFLISIHVILSRHFAIHIGNIIRISFASVVTGIIATYFKPQWTIFACGLSDLIASLLFPTGTYFFGFTISAMIGGLIYAIILYDKPFKWWRIFLVEILCIIFVTGILNSYWLSLLIGNSFILIFLPRITEKVLLLPIEVFLIGYTLKCLLPSLKRHIVF